MSSQGLKSYTSVVIWICKLLIDTVPTRVLHDTCLQTLEMQSFPFFPSSMVLSYLNSARCVNCSCPWRGRLFWDWQWVRKLTSLGVAASRGLSQWFSASRFLSRERSAYSPGKRGEKIKTTNPISNR